MEDNASMLTTQETSQIKLVNITNLKKPAERTLNDSQNYGKELNEEVPEDIKTPVKYRPLERPSLINFNNELEVYMNLVVRTAMQKKQKGEESEEDQRNYRYQK